jgi:SAM-dependent methyltransferase
VQRIFVDPNTKQILERDPEGNLFSSADDKRCVYKRYDGCFDFALTSPTVTETRNVYDEFYAKGQVSILTLSTAAEAWFNRTEPWRTTLINNLSPLAGKKILLLGNGLSYKEFYFLHLGAHLVFTDLSLVAVKRAKAAFRASEFYAPHTDDIEFHAVDAMRLPFPDASFDVIYGVKLEGFLDNIPEFYSEVARCLLPGGVCRFIDDAYSPVWDTIRRIWVSQIKARFLWRNLSPLNRIRSGSTPFGHPGIKKELLAPYVTQRKFARLVFIREYFFLRITGKIVGQMVHWNPKYLRYLSPVLLAMKWIDRRLAKTKWMKRNSLAVIYGFDK